MLLDSPGGHREKGIGERVDSELDVVSTGTGTGSRGVY